MLVSCALIWGTSYIAQILGMQEIQEYIILIIMNIGILVLTLIIMYHLMMIYIG